MTIIKIDKDNTIKKAWVSFFIVPLCRAHIDTTPVTASIVLEFKVKEIDQREEIIKLATKLEYVQWGKPVGKTRIIINALDGLRRVSEIMDTIKVKMEDLSVRKNTLEDVFIDLTGRRLRD